jgi:DNA-binding transcriptional ArsR family regulator
MPTPTLIWEWGTAYDLFISLHALHYPTDFGLRGAWAAGVRSRLPADAREVLELITAFLIVPFRWLHTLPDPKDSTTVLWTLRQISPEKRISTLLLDEEEPQQFGELLERVAERRAWDEADYEEFRDIYAHHKKPPAKKVLRAFLDWYTRPEVLGGRYLEGLQAYQEVFFAEEERRITPYLRQALTQAQDLAERMPLPDLLEELSRGLRMTSLQDIPELVLAPSFWITPLIVYGNIDAERMLFMFGARPDDASLVPGEVVPDALTQALKALSDPTRLRILRYLSEDTLTVAQLARRLRLRAPTVIHHLHTLRLAGLVHLTVEEGNERYYATRHEAITAACAALERFLGQ